MISKKVNGWEVTLCQGDGAFYAHLDLAGGLQISNAKVYGVNSLNPYQSLRVEKVDIEFVVIGSCLIGGGCGSSKEDRVLTPAAIQVKAQGALESNQSNAAIYANSILELTSQGIFSNLPLKELNDIPIATVESPLYIAKTLLEALGNDNVWTNKFRFQIRYTLARLARRYLVDYIILKPTIFASTKEEIQLLTDEIDKMTAVQSKASAIDSGVKAEFSIIKTLIDQLKTNQRWWHELNANASLLLEFYSSKNPVPVLIRSYEILNQLKNLITTEAKVERSLMIDRLYAMKDQDAISQFIDIIQNDQPWETSFLALAYVEWALYRGKFKKEEQLEALRPSLERLIQLKNVHLNGKLLSLLLKLGEQGKFSDLLDILKKENEFMMDFLKELPVVMLAPETQLGCLCNLSETLTQVVGRENELAEVTLQLLEHKNIAIVGIPGMGKSVLGYAVAQSLIPEFEIVWRCNAEDELTLEASLLPLASALNVETSAKENYMMLRQKLSNYNRVLLLMDNADSRKQSTYNQLEVAGVQFLMTSRDSNFNHSIHLNGWSEDVSVDFFMQKLKTECTKSEAILLVQMLSCVPLALKIAKALVNEEDWPVAELIDELKQDITVLDGKDQLFNIIKTSLAKTVQRHRNIQEFLCLRALLSPDSVSISLFEALAKDLNLDLNCRRFFTYAKSASLIEVTPSSTSIHRLVQSIVLETYPVCVRSLLPQLIQSLEKHFESSADTRELLRSIWNTLEYIINNGLVMNFSSFCIDTLKIYFEQGITKVLTEALLKVSQITSVDMHTISSFRQAKMCKMLQQGGDYGEASKYCLAALEGIENEQPIDQSNIYTYAASLYESKDELAKAEQYYIKCLNIRKELLGPKHPSLATTFSNLGGLYRSKGNSAKAEQYYVKCLNIREEVLGPKHLSLATTFSNLGGLYKSKDDLVKAEEYYIKCLNIEEEVLGPKHFSLAGIYNNLGSLYFSKGDLFKAEEYFIKCLNLEEEALGPKHPSLATTFNNIGMLSMSKGDLVKAEQYYIKSLNIREEVLGPKHRSLAITYNNLGGLYESKGDLVKAEEYYIKCLNIEEEVLGSKHPSLAITYNNLGGLYESKGDFEKSEECRKKYRALH